MLYIYTYIHCIHYTHPTTHPILSVCEPAGCSHRIPVQPCCTIEFAMENLDFFVGNACYSRRYVIQIFEDENC